MARVYGITLPAGVEVIYNKTLKMYDISVNCNIGKNRRFLSRSMKLNLKDFTKLYQIAELWSLYSQAQKDAWYTAADVQGNSGYNLFTQDQIYRLLNSIPGQATPSTYHQYLVGHIGIGGLATYCRIHQFYNKPWRLPATLKMNYHSDLTAVGPSPSAILRWRSMSYFSGKNVTVDLDTDLDLSAAWKNVDVDIPSRDGTPANFTLEIQLVDVQGDFWFDDIYLEWDGELQNRDPFCDDVTKWWNALDFPDGCTFESVYPTGAAL